jgi:hypothetical protein
MHVGVSRNQKHMDCAQVPMINVHRNTHILIFPQMRVRVCSCSAQEETVEFGKKLADPVEGASAESGKPLPVFVCGVLEGMIRCEVLHTQRCIRSIHKI